MSIIKGLQALTAPLWQPETVDLTKPNTGVTQEERDYLIRAGRTIYGVPLAKVVSLEDYRWKRNLLGRRPRSAPGPYGIMDPRD